MQQFIITTAQIKEATEISNILNEVLDEDQHQLFNFKNKINIKEQEDYIRYINNKKGSVFLVASIENKIIGFLDFISDEKNDFGTMGIIIQKAYRQNGIAFKLLSELLKRKTVTTINAEVLATNQPMIHFLQKNNFVFNTTFNKTVDFNN